MTWTREEFEAAVSRAPYENPEWRYGQALFNTLWSLDPELANLVRGSNADPFYARKVDDPRIARFYKEIFG